MDSPPTTLTPARTRLVPAMALGFVNRCPHCGEGKMFGRFLKFYAAFSREVLGTYASKISIDAASAQGTAAKP